MKFFVTNPNNDFAETPVQEEGRIIHHLHLAKGKEVPEHSADALVTVFLFFKSKLFMFLIFLNKNPQTINL